MIWKYSDGTEVALGGLVTGASSWALRVRKGLRYYPMLGGVQGRTEATTVDPSNPALLDAWLERELRDANRRLNVNLLERPEGFEPWVPPTVPSDLPDDEDTVY